MDDNGEDSIYNEMYLRRLMNRAEECTNSESCNLDEAQTFLDDMIYQLQKCDTVVTVAASDAVVTTKLAICDNIDVTTEIVANLREKITKESKKVSALSPEKLKETGVHVLNVMLGVYVFSTILHGVATVPNVPVDSPFYTDFLSSTMSMNTNTRGVTPILPQEIVWSIRDGYFPSLLAEFIHNGGLMVDTSAFDTKVVAFTPQEWIWSIQNGGFPHLLQENIKYGGLVVDGNFNSETTPMTIQDVVMSIQGGYVGTAVQHFYRNGGV